MTQLAKPSAKELGISQEALDIYSAADVIDLHIDSFIWTRVFGYQLQSAHPPDLRRAGRFGGLLFSQCDVPRVLASGLTGSHWVISTNPFRSAKSRARTLTRNMGQLAATLEAHPEVALVRTVEQYFRARREGRHAAWLAIQGANALDSDISVLDRPQASSVGRVTLVHLTSPAWGRSSWPGGRARQFTSSGEALVRALNQRRIFVDLAHAHPTTFWQAVAVHAKNLPLLVSHTGVSGVRPHWRNLDDDQIRAIAKSGGTIGILFHRPYLASHATRHKSGCQLVVDHLEYIIRLVGDDFVSLGSDFDGLILPPKDLRTCLALPRLVEEMLRRGWQTARIGKILGGNWLRALAALQAA